jgi:hypothetical protein
MQIFLIVVGTSFLMLLAMAVLFITKGESIEGVMLLCLAAFTFYVIALESVRYYRSLSVARNQATREAHRYWSCRRRR